MEFSPMENLCPARSRNALRQLLRHNNLSAAVWTPLYRELIHKRLDQEYSASGCAQNVFFGQRIRHLREVKPRALVRDVDHHLLAFKFDREDDFLLALLRIAVIVGVNHAFAHGHPDLVNIVLVKATGFGDALHDAFGKIDALDERFERDLETLCSSHRRCGSPKRGNQAMVIIGRVGPSIQPSVRIRGSGSRLCSRVHRAREEPQNLRLKLAARLKSGRRKTRGVVRRALEYGTAQDDEILKSYKGRGSGSVAECAIGQLPKLLGCASLAVGNFLQAS